MLVSRKNILVVSTCKMKVICNNKSRILFKFYQVFSDNLKVLPSQGRQEMDTEHFSSYGLQKKDVYELLSFHRTKAAGLSPEGNQKELYFHLKKTCQYLP